MENQTRTNEELFSDYYDLISATLSRTYVYESKRVLGKFREFIGEFPPTVQLAIKFLGQSRDRRPSTRA